MRTWKELADKCTELRGLKRLGTAGGLYRFATTTAANEFASFAGAGAKFADLRILRADVFVPKDWILRATHEE